MNYKKLTFNNNVYPVVELNIYDYNYNGSKKAKVSTKELERDIYKALTSGDKALIEKANNVDPEVKYFVPKSLLMKSEAEDVAKYVTEHCIK